MMVYFPTPPGPNKAAHQYALCATRRQGHKCKMMMVFAVACKIKLHTKTQLT